MLFETIDEKNQCRSIVIDKKIDPDPDYNQLSKTWSYHSSLKDYDIEYASLYVNGNSLDMCCPEKLKEKWNDIKEKHFAYIKSFQNGFCELHDQCFYDLVPESFVIDYFTAKNHITEHVLNNYE